MSAVSVSRNRVYAVIDGERSYQIDQQGNAKRHADQPPMTPGEHILCMEKCLADARTAWYAPNGGVACLDHVRKVAALAVVCMELHGAPPRTGYLPVDDADGNGATYETITDQSEIDRAPQAVAE